MSQSLYHNLFMPTRHLHPRASGLIVFGGGGGGGTVYTDVNGGQHATEALAIDSNTAINAANVKAKKAADEAAAVKKAEEEAAAAAKAKAEAAAKAQAEQEAAAAKVIEDARIADEKRREADAKLVVQGQRDLIKSAITSHSHTIDILHQQPALRRTSTRI